MPFIRVYIHFVWSTKHREPLLNSPELRKKVWIHMRRNAINRGIYVDTIGGFSDHCHCLVSIGTNQTLGEIVQMMKGESSRWINQNRLCKIKFEWQHDYFAIAVSDSQLLQVRRYIRNQEIHHTTNSFSAEEEQLMKITKRNEPQNEIDPDQ